MAVSDYISAYTGAQIDSAYTNTPELISWESFVLLDPTQMSTSKVYIISDGTNANTLWRSNGSAKVQLSGGSGGGGGGGVVPIADPGTIPSGAATMYGLQFLNSGNVFKVASATLQQTGSSGGDTFYTLNFL